MIARESMPEFRRDGEYLIFNPGDFLRFLAVIGQADSVPALKETVRSCLEIFMTDNGKDHVPDGTFRVKKVVLERHLKQISGALTMERAAYYIRRLEKYVTSVPSGPVDMKRWQDYDEIITDSLWNLESRDRSEGHDAGYWGNFVPQIPRQLMLRYTSPGDLVLEPFMGGGTTLLEAMKMNRNYIGVDLNPDLVDLARRKASSILSDSRYFLECADSSRTDFSRLLEVNGFNHADLVILHPPYHDIIKFTENPADLSRSPSVDDFLQSLFSIVSASERTLKRGGYLTMVIGDKYDSAQWIPLGFMVMQEILKTGLILKSIVVKNFNRTKGKRGQEMLWRYRALAGGFYVFKHEYIFIFRKRR